MYTLLNSIRRFALTREDAEDVLLEVFMIAFERNALAGLSEGEQLALDAEERALLRARLTNLPEQQQQILRMRFGHGLRCTEIARKLDKSESAVRMTLARTLNRLRRIL